MMGDISRGDLFRPFTIQDVREELQHMKCRSAVGPDGVGVHLLREIASHDDLQDGLLSLINHVVRTQELPTRWEKQVSWRFSPNAPSLSYPVIYVRYVCPQRSTNWSVVSYVLVQCLVFAVAPASPAAAGVDSLRPRWHCQQAPRCDQGVARATATL